VFIVISAGRVKYKAIILNVRSLSFHRHLVRSFQATFFFRVGIDVQLS
jgi:hypothetical protein